ncbi:hypothetical protein A7D33_11060 [Candidatus Methylacidiphilum fumarolicum]|nr:hypothetical protein A7D33_11060 [Candidatus Methylacidiphilum fumarolicum]
MLGFIKNPPWNSTMPQGYSVIGLLNRGSFNNLLKGSERINLILGNSQHHWLARNETAITLCYRDGTFFMHGVIKTKSQTPTGHNRLVLISA